MTTTTTEKTFEDILRADCAACRAKGYNPTRFLAMLARYGAVETCRRLVMAGNVQTGFTKLKELGLEATSIETRMLEHPHLFTREDLAAAQWRRDFT